MKSLIRAVAGHRPVNTASAATPSARAEHVAVFLPAPPVCSSAFPGQHGRFEVRHATEASVSRIC
jgi:hypothetical protein